MEEKDKPHGGKYHRPALITAGQIGLRKPPLRLVISILLVQGVFRYSYFPNPPDRLTSECAFLIPSQI